MAAVTDDTALERRFRVRRVLLSDGGESWTVIGESFEPVEVVDRYLAWLTPLRSPRTVEGYARDLRWFWCFLARRELQWSEVGVQELGEFAAWLRQPAPNVVALGPDATARRAPGTVNRMLSAVVGFYEHQARHGNDLARRLIDRMRTGRGPYKPFLHGLAPAGRRGRVVRLRERERLPRVLTLSQLRAIIEAQQRLRDRFLFALLAGTGMRIGQALGLRHEDIVSWERRVELVAREDNVNRARGKGGRGSVPISGELVRLWSDYMHEEYGALESDYVFVNLWGGRVGRPMSYATVDDHTLLVAGSMTIEDFNEAGGTQLPEEGVRTMAGLVFSALGRRPQPDDTVTVGSIRLTVEQMDGMRITRLRVELTPRVPRPLEGAGSRRPAALDAWMTPRSHVACSAPLDLCRRPG